MEIFAFVLVVLRYIRIFVRIILLGIDSLDQQIAGSFILRLQRYRAAADRRRRRGYGAAVQTASAAGHREIVQLLLDTGADITARGGMLGNALQVASFQGHTETVQLLRDAGANVTV
jgi:hypothetical protein